MNTKLQKLVDALIDHSYGYITLDKLQACGALVLAFGVLSLTLDFANYLYVHFLRGGKNLKKSFGEWAVVTGSTDGIGKAMAFEFAKKGLNVVLISRTKDKLDACAKELKDKYSSVQVKVLAIDYSSFGEKERKQVSDLLDPLNVGVLVNNVGISYENTTFFHEISDSRVDQLMSLNVGSTTWMTRIVLPKMLEKKKGAVINISSAAGVANSPLLSQYGAAKSYISMFSRAMHYEYAAKGVHFQCQVPMFVTTKLAKLRNTSLFVCSEKAYATAAVAAIGYEPLISPYWSHAIQIWLLTTLPEWLVAQHIIMPMHKGIRAKALKKEANKKA